MKKIALFLFAISMAFSSYSKEIVVTKKGGKKCASDKTKVCYNYVKVSDNDEKYTQTCSGGGLNTCPTYTIITVGPLGSIQFDLENFAVNVEISIMGGNTSGNGFIVDGNGVNIAHYTWTGLINPDGFVDYTIIINDEI